MLESMKCFFVGHDRKNARIVNSPFPDFTTMRQIFTVQRIYCGRCDDVIGVDGNAPTPKGLHKVYIFDRPRLFGPNKSFCFKAVCWCGYQSPWTTEYRMALKFENIHTGGIEHVQPATPEFVDKVISAMPTYEDWQID